MSNFPALSSKELLKLLEKGGADFVRQGSTDHAIYARIVEEIEKLIIKKSGSLLVSEPHEQFTPLIKIKRETQKHKKSNKTGSK